ncbi:TPA: O-antigen ligase family protein [Aeromonas sobria]|nr:O-antigen ligase family protein [Aeromonas sobria]HEH9432858.1 O-antigen ligase family protein [Aeromonas sobria]
MINPKKVECFLVCALAASIFTSKPAITITASLLVVFFILRCIYDIEYFSELKSERLLFFPVLLFFFGVVSTIISSGSMFDAGYFAYKGLFLLTFPALILALKNKINMKLVFFISMLGFSISILLSFYQFYSLSIDGWHGQRFGGLWDVQRWAEITTFVFVFLLAKLSDELSWTKKTIINISLMVILMSLILSGGRAGWVAVAFVTITYMLFFYRRQLIVFTVLLSVLTFSIYKMQTENVDLVINRIVSVTETTEKDYSNYSRLLMWRNGLDFIAYNLSENPAEFFFGVGVKRFESEYINFLDMVGDSKILMGQTQRNYSFSDMHNAYLDSASKLGVFYSILFYSFLLYVIYSFSKVNQTVKVLGLILAFMITGVFYTNYLEFQTSSLFFLVAIAYAEGKYKKVSDYV